MPEGIKTIFGHCLAEVGVGQPTPLLPPPVIVSARQAQNPHLEQASNKHFHFYHCWCPPLCRVPYFSVSSISHCHIMSVQKQRQKLTGVLGQKSSCSGTKAFCATARVCGPWKEVTSFHRPCKHTITSFSTHVF